MEGRACLSCVARTTSILAHTHTHCCHCQWHWKLDFSLPADRFGSDSLKRPVMRRRRRRWWFLAARFPSIFDRLTHRSVQLQRADLRGHFRAFPRSIEGPRRHPAVVRIPTLMKLLLWRPFHGLLALFFLLISSSKRGLARFWPIRVDDASREDPIPITNQLHCSRSSRFC